MTIDIMKSIFSVDCKEKADECPNGKEYKRECKW
jgi:hypothetical protein